MLARPVSLSRLAFRAGAPLLAALAATSPALGASGTLIGTVTGSFTPTQAPSTQNVANGGFLILANPLAPATGDGVDEHTQWTFALSTDSEYPAFVQPGHRITGASLTLRLKHFFTPLGPVTDLVRPLDLFPIIAIPEFLPPNTVGSITFDLLESYSPGALRDLILSNSGRMRWVYADDAIIGVANININFNDCLGDFNGDGQRDFFDYLDFASAFAGESPAADVNNDGSVDFFDYLDFVAAYDAGC
ncbi:MAG: hypothetical protein SFZ23_13685 [Planctomycetota bacterium]|nr:hypothetical protein [Planctomycetota bacterium]